jgi:hypothetical protein
MCEGEFTPSLRRIHGGDAGMWTQVALPGLVSDGDVVEIG